ncbi:MAG: VTC domain-containing protein, partial [Prevotellaceae bacterium]|nr:VTC domain-containing protein [Prevotellaceae bacterium]
MQVEDVLKTFAPISLAEMKDIRLMNRTDTKFVTTRAKLVELLLLAKDDY